MKKLLFCASCATILAACDNGRTPLLTTADAVDSAGVRVVSSASPRWTAGNEWHLSESPSVEIGKEGSDELHQFAGIISVARLSDGRIAVANRRPYVVRIYSPEGKYLNDVGRRGQGPGEYQYLARLLRLPGDSLLVVSETGASTVFTPDGKMVRAVNLEKAPRDFGEMAQNGIAPRPLAVFADGSILSQASVTSFSAKGGRFPEGISADSLEFHHYSPQGVRLHSIGTFDEYERFVSGALHYVRSATSERVYATAGNRFYTGNGRTFEIRALTPDGAVREIMRLTTPAVPFTADSIARRRDKRIAAAKDAAARAEIENIYSVMDFPDSLPRFSDMIATEDGSLWVNEYSTVSPARWYVFDTDGAWLGTVNVPARFALKIVTGDLAFGVALDEDDVETLRVYRIIKSGG